MCLEYAGNVPEHLKSGTFIKEVRRIPGKEDEFLPYFSHFSTRGNGGLSTFYQPLPDHLKKELRKTRTVYKLGRTYRVRSKALAIAANGTPYPVGVHGWISTKYPSATIHISIDCALVEFEYHQAIVMDNQVIVARRVRPLRVIRLGWPLE